MQQACPRVERRQAVPRARDDLQELREAVGEIDNLRDEEDEERFRKMAQNASDGEGHAGEVGVGVADELLREKERKREKNFEGFFFFER